MEIERRQLRYAGFAAELGLAYFEVRQFDLGKSETFATMLRVLGMETGGLTASDHETISATRHNRNTRRLAKPDNLEKQEADLWRAVLPYERLLPSAIQAKYLTAQTAVAA